MNHLVWLRGMGWLGVGLCWLWLGACQLESGRVTQTREASVATQTQSIINGKTDLRYPAVGALLESGRVFCTGALIGQRLVLTASHCVDTLLQSRISFRIDVPSQSASKGYTSHFYLFDNQYIKIHPNWTGNVGRGYDVAIAVLRQPVPANIATPLPFNTDPLPANLVGQKVLFLGYGLVESYPNAVSPDTKQGAEIPVTRLTSKLIYTFSQQANTCHGDSGGPSLLNIGGKLKIVGVNSFTQSTSIPGAGRTRCDGQGGAARVDLYARFIQSWVDRFGDPPAACKVDNECTQCESCNLSAAPSTCARKQSLQSAQYCKPCAKDADCGSNSVCHRFDEGFRCLQKCPASGCCPSGSKCTQFTSNNQEDWFCVPDGTKCPPVQCAADTDCGPGEVCQNGTCQATLPARSKSLCFPCRKTEDCVDADGKQVGYCIGPVGQGYCSQPCGTADFCPSGFTCQQPYAGVPKQCMPAKGTCRLSCSEDKDCPTDFTCQQNLCSRKGGGQADDFCDPMPCQSGLACVQTLYGKRCLQACGTPIGVPGSNCLSNGKCTGTATCYTVSSTRAVCLQSCQSDSQCNGAPCIGGVCKCTQDSDCYKDNYCNKATGFFSSCLPDSFKRPCKDTTRTCQQVDGTGYCVGGGAGHVAFGQPCDGANRCRSGLACVQGKDGARCLEDCTKTRGCRLGGVCSAEKDGVAVCVCSRNRDCSSGRSCSAPFYLEQFGYCVNENASTSCSNTLECPPQQVCETGACVPAPPTPEVVEEPTPEPGPEPTPEPAPEPRPEPVVPDAPAPGPEPAPTPEPRPEPTPTDKGKAADTGPDLPQSKDGCQCASLSTLPNGPTKMPFSLLVLFFVGLCLHCKRR